MNKIVRKIRKAYDGIILMQIHTILQSAIIFKEGTPIDQADSKVETAFGGLVRLRRIECIFEMSSKKKEPELF